MALLYKILKKNAKIFGLINKKSFVFVEVNNFLVRQGYLVTVQCVWVMFWKTFMHSGSENQSWITKPKYINSV